MTSELPRPGSVWRYLGSQYQTRVIYSSETDIIAHNCEQPTNGYMVSWRGDLTAFFETFEGPDPNVCYPATAH